MSACVSAGRLWWSGQTRLRLPPQRLRALRFLPQLEALLRAAAAHPGFFPTPLSEAALQRVLEEGLQTVLCPAPAGGGLRLVLSTSPPLVQRRAEIRVVWGDEPCLELHQAGRVVLQVGSLEKAWAEMGMMCVHGGLQEAEPPSAELPPSPMPPLEPPPPSPQLTDAEEATRAWASFCEAFSNGAAAAEEPCAQLHALASTKGGVRTALAHAGMFDFALLRIAEARGWAPSQDERKEESAPAAHPSLRPPLVPRLPLSPAPPAAPPRIPLLRLGPAAPSESAPSEPPLHPLLPALLALLLRLLLSPDGAQLQPHACGGGAAWAAGGTMNSCGFAHPNEAMAAVHTFTGSSSVGKAGCN